MWRLKYTVIVNMYRLQGILETMHRMIDRDDLYTEQEKYDYVRYIIGLIKETGFIKVEGFGMENLPAEGGYVLYPNHQGKFDAYAIADAHEKALSAVMDREMSYFVLIDEIIRILNAKRLDLNNARQALKIINQIAEEVAQGRRYIIFPEGGYTNEERHTLWDFKPGCFKAAVRANAPIVPVTLVDSWRVFNSRQITPVKCQVHFLEPIMPEEYEGMSTREIATLVKARIQAKLAELGY